VRPPFVLASLLCSMLLALNVRAEGSPLPANGKRAGLEIVVDEQGWGAVNTRDIQKVLYSVADTLLPPTSPKTQLRIRVSHTDSNPIALYDRGPTGEYLIRLHANRARWHLYVYEFAHELCHVLSNYDRAGADVVRRNQWLEETLCETASLYALGSLGTQWAEASADPQLVKQAAGLRRFFRSLVTEGHRNLPEGSELDDWLRQHVAHLCDDPYQREINDLLAKSMVPLFFADPSGWDAIAYMNLHPDDATASVDEFLGHWRANAPERDQAFVARLSSLFVGALANTKYSQADTDLPGSAAR